MAKHIQHVMSHIAMPDMTTEHIHIATKGPIQVKTLKAAQDKWPHYAYTYTSQETMADQQTIQVGQKAHMTVHRPALSIAPTIEQHIDIHLDMDAELEYLAPYTLTMETHPYRQYTDITMNATATCLYTNGIWSIDKAKVGSHKDLHVTMNHQSIVDDTVRFDHSEDGMLNTMGHYHYYGDLLVIHHQIDTEFLNHLRAKLVHIKNKGMFSLKALDVPGMMVRCFTQTAKELVNSLIKVINTMREECLHLPLYQTLFL